MVVLLKRAARLYKGHEADKTGMGLIAVGSPLVVPGYLRLPPAETQAKPRGQHDVVGATEFQSQPAQGTPRLTKGDTSRAKSRTGFTSLPRKMS
jgi:hypothetical protein